MHDMAKLRRVELPKDLTEEMLTGIDELDTQHGYFLELVRAISEVGDQGNSAQASALILEIVRYTQSHFAFEETLMKVYGYPELEHHVAQHAEILRSISGVMSSPEVNLAKLKLQLLKWLSGHISLCDKPMAQFVLANRPQMTTSSG